MKVFELFNLNVRKLPIVYKAFLKITKFTDHGKIRFYCDILFQK